MNEIKPIVINKSVMDQVTEMPVNSVVLIGTREDDIYDALLRTGPDGWLTARRDNTRYLKTADGTLENYIYVQAREAMRFFTV